jgi:hypothetical protein
MIDNTQSPQTTRITGGPWLHRGQLHISLVLDDGSLVKVVLPDDLWALMNRVSALEAAAMRPPVA